MKDKVCVIVATYNHPKEYLVRALESVLSQDYPNKEVIIVDDGSENQDAKEVAEWYAGVRYHRIPHSGLPIARNTGLFMTDAKYFLPFDDDDILYPGAISALVAAFDSSRVGVTYGSMFLFSKDDLSDAKFYDPRTPMKKEAWKKESQIFQTSMVLMDAFRDVGGYWPKAWTAEDWDFYLRIFLKGWTFKDAGVVVYHHRVWPGGKWEGGEKFRFKEYREMVLRHCEVWDED